MNWKPDVSNLAGDLELLRRFPQRVVHLARPQLCHPKGATGWGRVREFSAPFTGTGIKATMDLEEIKQAANMSRPGRRDARVEFAHAAHSRAYLRTTRVHRGGVRALVGVTHGSAPARTRQMLVDTLVPIGPAWIRR